jgi:hypothetical protein
MDEQELLHRQMEVAPGVWKTLGDCTTADLEAAGEIDREKATISVRLGELGTQLANAAGPSQLQSISLPAWLGEEKDGPGDVGVEILRARLAELETIAALVRPVPGPEDQGGA